MNLGMATLVLPASLLGAAVPLSAVRAQPSRPAPACAPDTGSIPASAWLERARQAVGMGRTGGRVVRFHSVESVEENFQSDRTYPPFFSAFTTRDAWLDPATGVERLASHTTFIGQEFGDPVLLNTPAATWQVSDTALAPAAPYHGPALIARQLDPWAVLRDWSANGGVRVEGRCAYRDHPRVVLLREGRFGPERLFLDPKSAFPVKLDRVEPHYLWGQQRVEYVYSTWVLDDGVAHPGSTFRVADGDVEVSRTIESFALVQRDSAPPLAAPAAAPMDAPLPLYLQALPPDTARVGRMAFVLRNRGYGEAVALARDTVFVFDATQSEDRARQDSAWIGRLFPGRHPVVLVVTDLAWPHVGGVRFWVASGATVVSHPSSRAFLERVIARQWTLAPDKLQQARPRPRLRFRAVSDSAAFAGGDVGVYAIDGVGSEGALMVYLPRDRFLWASDFVQDLSQPTLYATEVWRAARRAGLDPAAVAAAHVRTAPWDAVRRVAESVEIEAPPRGP